MKRYKDCMLVCNVNQSIEDLMEIVAQVSIEKGYEISRQSSFVNNDTIIVKLIKEGFPQSRLILGYYSEKKGVSILNIVPTTESGVSEINCDTYNELLDMYKSDVFGYILDNQNNEIEENLGIYTIEEFIPKSFEKLNNWLNAYPLSSHQLDLNRWYDFVIALHQNEENLPVDVLVQYLQEEYNWEEKNVEKIALRLESNLSLLEYYDHNK
jgi:hypothetical protein